mmetsp:Transcript_58294/g.155210  ORF Transcript_58294/g.155210 Transcript_58294/m.155210 type:complete len:363 (+) Transcript_58294:389-1477(+)
MAQVLQQSPTLTLAACRVFCTVTDTSLAQSTHFVQGRRTFCVNTAHLVHDGLQVFEHREHPDGRARGEAEGIGQRPLVRGTLLDHDWRLCGQRLFQSSDAQPEHLLLHQCLTQSLVRLRADVGGDPRRIDWLRNHPSQCQEEPNTRRLFLQQSCESTRHQWHRIDKFEVPPCRRTDDGQHVNCRCDCRAENGSNFGTARAPLLPGSSTYSIFNDLEHIQSYWYQGRDGFVLLAITCITVHASAPSSGAHPQCLGLSEAHVQPVEHQRQHRKILMSPRLYWCRFYGLKASQNEVQQHLLPVHVQQRVRKVSRTRRRIPGQHQTHNEGCLQLKFLGQRLSADHPAQHAPQVAVENVQACGSTTA